MKLLGKKLTLRVADPDDALRWAAGAVALASRVAKAGSTARGVLAAMAGVLDALADAVDEDGDGGGKITEDEATSIGVAVVRALADAGVVQ